MNLAERFVLRLVCAGMEEGWKGGEREKERDFCEGLTYGGYHWSKVCDL